MPGPAITRWSALVRLPARRAVALTLPLLVVACATPPTTAAHTAKAATSPSAAVAVAPPATRDNLNAQAATPTPAASAAPAVLPSAGTSLLLPPSGAHQSLSGHVTLDSASLTARSAVALAVGGAAVAAPGGSILSNNSGSLVVGGNVVSLASGNAIPGVASGVDATLGGAAFVTADGRLLPSGGIISDNGGEIVANNSGGLIANNSAGVIANNAGNRRLLDVSTAGAAVPVAGALVSAVSLTTHMYLPVGVNSAGKPIYSVFTDLAGGYQLYLPPADAGNVLIAIGAAPKAGTDVRYNAIATSSATAGTTADVNEDGDIAAQAIRTAFINDMALALTSSNATDKLLGDLGGGAAERDAVQQFVNVVNGGAQKVGVPQNADAVRIPAVRALAAILCDATLGGVDPSQLQLSPALATVWLGSPESVQSALGAASKALRLQTAAYLALHPAPTTVTYVLDGRTNDQASAPFCAEHVLVPLTTDTDLLTYAFNLMVTGNELHPTINLSRAYAAVAEPTIPLDVLDGAPHLTSGPLSLPSNPDVYTDPLNHLSLQYSSRIQAALTTVTGAIALSLSATESGAGAAALSATLTGAINTFAASHAFTATPQPEPTASFHVIPCATGAAAATGATSAGS